MTLSEMLWMFFGMALMLALQIALHKAINNLKMEIEE